MTERGQAIAAGSFIALAGGGLIAWNWVSVSMYHEFGPKTAWLGPVLAVYGLAHARNAQDARVLGSPAWATTAFALGLAAGAANWYALCRALCESCSLRSCF